MSRYSRTTSSSASAYRTSVRDPGGYASREPLPARDDPAPRKRATSPVVIYNFYQNGDEGYEENYETHNIRATSRDPRSSAGRGPVPAYRSSAARGLTPSRDLRGSSRGPPPSSASRYRDAHTPQRSIGDRGGAPAPRTPMSASVRSRAYTPSSAASSASRRAPYSASRARPDDREDRIRAAVRSRLYSEQGVHHGAAPPPSAAPHHAPSHHAPSHHAPPPAAASGAGPRDMGGSLAPYESAYLDRAASRDERTAHRDMLESEIDRLSGEAEEARKRAEEEAKAKAEKEEEVRKRAEELKMTADQNAILQKTAEFAKKDLEEAKKEHAASLARERDSKKEVLSQVEALQAELQKHRNVILKLDTERKAADKMRAESENRRNAMINKHEAMAEHIKNLAEKLREAKNHCKRRDEELASLAERFEEKKKELKAAKERENKLLDELDALKSIRSNLESAVASRERTLKEKEEAARKLHAASEEARKDHNDERVERSRLAKDLDALREQVRVLRNDNKQLVQNVQTLQTENEHYRKENAHYKVKTHALETDTRRKAERMQELTEDLKDETKRARDLEAATHILQGAVVPETPFSKAERRTQNNMGAAAGMPNIDRSNETSFDLFTGHPNLPQNVKPRNTPSTIVKRALDQRDSLSADAYTMPAAASSPLPSRSDVKAMKRVLDFADQHTASGSPMAVASAVKEGELERELSAVLEEKGTLEEQVSQLADDAAAKRRREDMEPRLEFLRGEAKRLRHKLRNRRRASHGHGSPMPME